MLALAILTSGHQLQPLCAMENSFVNNALHANHHASLFRLFYVTWRRGAAPSTSHHSPASPAPTVLCADRVGQMTKTYNDIDAVTRLLEEVGCSAFPCSAS